MWIKDYIDPEIYSFSDTKQSLKQVDYVIGDKDIIIFVAVVYN